MVPKWFGFGFGFGRGRHHGGVRDRVRVRVRLGDGTMGVGFGFRFGLGVRGFGGSNAIMVYNIGVLEILRGWRYHRYTPTIELSYLGEFRNVL